MKNKKTRKVKSILVNLNVTRYEDTGKGYATLEQAESSVVAYADKLIADRKGLAGVVKSIDLVDCLSEDNGEECDGEDIGRWSVHLKYVARFELLKPVTYAEAWKEVQGIIVSFIEEYEEDSLEEYACSFSADPAHLPCRMFPPQA